MCLMRGRSSALEIGPSKDLILYVHGSSPVGTTELNNRERENSCYFKGTRKLDVPFEPFGAMIRLLYNRHLLLSQWNSGPPAGLPQSSLSIPLYSPS